MKEAVLVRMATSSQRAGSTTQHGTHRKNVSIDVDGTSELKSRRTIVSPRKDMTNSCDSMAAEIG